MAVMTDAELHAFAVAGACLYCERFDTCIIGQRIFNGTLMALAEPESFDRRAAMDCQSGKEFVR